MNDSWYYLCPRLGIDLKSHEMMDLELDAR